MDKITPTITPARLQDVKIGAGFWGARVQTNRAVTLEAELNRLGVASDFVRLQHQATVTKLRVLSRHQQLLRLDFEDGFPRFDPAALLARFETHLSEADVVLLSDYGKGALRGVQDYISRARAAGLPVSILGQAEDVVI